jgi:hypothetical protein
LKSTNSTGRIAEPGEEKQVRARSAVELGRQLTEEGGGLREIFACNLRPEIVFSPMMPFPAGTKMRNESSRRFERLIIA